ncbi:MAG: tripartite tricarboxylate transporter substrate binding protein [Betaproteobacteria bacterium]|nr:tripartite tricarboxylate transporter substrate binding protein [Betaproteobacteria bacterium]
MTFTRSFIALVLVGIGMTVAAQDYPAKPIRLIVPFGPGGTTDILSRVLGERLGERFGQQVLIDNRPGAGGNIAAEITARAAPDGYTIFLGSMGTQSINISIYPKLAFDPLKDFAAISLVVNSANLLLVHPSIPANTVKQLIELAKAKPERFSYSTSGSGSFNHMSAELFSLMANIKMVHIPYKSGGQALTAVVSGEADVLFQTIPATLPFVEAKRLKPIAVCTLVRHPLFPKLPTANESGLPGFDISTWYGILAPAATPKAIVDKLNDALVQIIKNPATNKRLLELGVDPVTNTPEQFNALVRADLAKWAKVAKAANIKVN